MERAVALVLCSFAQKLAGHRVKWFTNNKNIVRIVESGNKTQPIALDI